MARITLDHLAHAYGADRKGPEDYALKEIDHVWRAGRRLCAARAIRLRQDHASQHHLGARPPQPGQDPVRRTGCDRLPTEARNIAQVFQFPVVYDTMTVRREPGVPAEEPRHAATDRRGRASRRSPGFSISRACLIERRAASPPT